MGSLVDYQYELRLSLCDTSAFPGMKCGKSSAIALHLLENTLSQFREQSAKLADP